MKKGIDISRWQGANFDIAGTGAEFVIIKAGGSDDGLYIDSQFLNNYITAKNLGLPVGIYWYTKAYSILMLRNEIEYLYDKIKGLQFELPIYLDLEEDVIKSLAAGYANEWLNAWPTKGYYPGIYTSLSWWKDSLYNVSMDPIQKWLALWITDSTPGYECGIWQNGHIKYNGEDLDSDIMFADFSFIKKNGLNGFKKEKTFSDVPSTRSDYRAIMWAASEGYIVGYKDGTFRPDNPLTRGQLCTILWRMAGKPNAK